MGVEMWIIQWYLSAGDMLYSASFPFVLNVYSFGYPYIMSVLIDLFETRNKGWVLFEIDSSSWVVPCCVLLLAQLILVPIVISFATEAVHSRRMRPA